MCPSALSSSFLRLMSETAPFVWHPSDGALSRPPVALGDSSNISHVITAMTPRLTIQESIVLAVHMLEIARDVQVSNPRDTVSAVSSQSSVFSPGRIMAFPVTSRTVSFLSNGTEEPLLCPHWSFPGVGVHPYLISTPHLGTPPSLHLFTPLKSRWSTTSIFSWVSPSQQGPPDHGNNSGQGEGRKSVFCPHGSCSLQWGRWSHCDTFSIPHTFLA